VTMGEVLMLRENGMMVFEKILYHLT